MYLVSKSSVKKVLFVVSLKVFLMDMQALVSSFKENFHQGLI